MGNQIESSNGIILSHAGNIIKVTVDAISWITSVERAKLRQKMGTKGRIVYILSFIALDMVIIPCYLLGKGTKRVLDGDKSTEHEVAY